MQRVEDALATRSMKTFRSCLAALASAGTLYGCATPVDYHGPAFVIVQLQLSKATCLDSLQAGFLGLGSGFESIPTQRCTKEKPHRGGFFASGYSGRDFPVRESGVLEISYRRAPEGRLSQVRLPLAGKVHPPKGFHVHALKAFVLDEGVRVHVGYVESNPRDRARARYSEEEVAYFPDQVLK